MAPRGSCALALATMSADPVAIKTTIAVAFTNFSFPLFLPIEC